MKQARMLGVRETARQLSCTLKYIYDLLYSGRLPGEKIGKQWRIPAQAVKAQLRRKANQCRL